MITIAWYTPIFTVRKNECPANNYGLNVASESNTTLGYGTITVLADDDTTPEVNLVRISRPTKIKEMIRTQYRAVRQREGVHPTEFMQSP